MEKKLSPSMEDYLEAAMTASEPKGYARLKEISDMMKVSKPSANSALSKLRGKGYLKQEKYGHIILTPKGRRKAREICRFHRKLSEFFTLILGMEKGKAQDTACALEHFIDGETLKRIACLTESLRKNRPLIKKILLCSMKGEEDEKS